MRSRKFDLLVKKDKIDFFNGNETKWEVNPSIMMNVQHRRYYTEVQTCCHSS